MSDNNDLTKQVASSNDLRHAIDMVNKVQIKKVVPAPPPAPPAPLEQSKNTELKHLGYKDSYIPGVVTHIVGIPNDTKHYEIDHNIKNPRFPDEHFTVQHIDGGKIKSRSPKIHDTLAHVVKHILNHHITGNWE